LLPSVLLVVLSVVVVVAVTVAIVGIIVVVGVVSLVLFPSPFIIFISSRSLSLDRLLHQFSCQINRLMQSFGSCKSNVPFYPFRKSLHASISSPFKVNVQSSFYILWISVAGQYSVVIIDLNSTQAPWCLFVAGEGGKVFVGGSGSGGVGWKSGGKSLISYMSFARIVLVGTALVGWQ
nr:hypothetical protein [Tanacetum cinerariifolium]